MKTLNNNAPPTKKHTQGLSLLEVLLAIVVTAMLIIVSVNYYSSVRMAQKNNYFIQQLSHIGSAVTNYIASNPDASLPDVFKIQSSSMTASLIANQVINPSDAKNVWIPGNQYMISVFPGTTPGSGYAACLIVEVDTQLPTSFNTTTASGRTRVQALKAKINAALRQANLANQNAPTVYFNSSGGYLRVQFCAS